MRIGIYVNNFTGDNPSNQPLVDELKVAGFNTVVIWAIQVHSDGTIMFNQQPIAQNGQFLMPWLPPLIQSLQTPPTLVDTVLFSIGAGSVDTWTHIEAALATPATALMLAQNFQAFSAALSFDGFDYDDEDNLDPATVQAFTQILSTPNARTITFCPYEDAGTWAGFLPPLYTWAQQQLPPRGQPVQWMNLQCYAGGTNDDASGLVQTFQTAISGVTGTGGGGIPYSYDGTYALEFIVPGLTVIGKNYNTNPPTNVTYTPAQIQAGFANLSGVGGGWLWNCGSVSGTYGYTLQDYAQAIIDGLNAAQ
jgi:hypothetical protein